MCLSQILESIASLTWLLKCIVPTTVNVLCTRLLKQTNVILNFRQYDTLKKDDKILAFFNDFNDCLDEEAMWQLSKEIKPQTRGRANKAH